MKLFPESNTFIPFPVLPYGLIEQFPELKAGMRHFGIYEEDLEIDFNGSDKHSLITHILEQCIIKPEDYQRVGIFNELSIGKRLECLLVLAAEGKSSAFNIPFRCTGCGQDLEFELTLDEISGQQHEADLIETVKVEVKGKSVVLRKPNGYDQEIWGSMVFRDEQEAQRAMIGTLAVTPVGLDTLAPDDLYRIGEAMDEADPLIDFVCHVTCGECGKQNDLLIDLCDMALGMLSRLQKKLIVMVHKLASNYHWSELEIFAVPDWRRKQYLEMVGEMRK